MEAVVSIHDVMPDTLERVQHLLDHLPLASHADVTLLVVPGGDWQPAHVDRLRQWADTGVLLAGHGWTHQVTSVKGFYHRLHSLLISRLAAEHLSLTTSEILELMQRNHDWFAAHDLPEPDLYVPPAWALGDVSIEALRALPFRYLETTSGLFDITTGDRRTIPLVGFEADTLLRQCLLTLNNTGNRILAGLMGAPLRISIHPYDHEYRLQHALQGYCRLVSRNVHYREVFAG